MEIRWAELDFPESVSALEMLLDMEAFATHAAVLQSGVAHSLVLAAACSEAEARLLARLLLECEARCGAVAEQLLDQLCRLPHAQAYFAVIPSMLSAASPKVSSAIIATAKAMLHDNPSLLLTTLQLLADLPPSPDTLDALQMLIDDAMGFIEDASLPALLYVIVKCQPLVNVQRAIMNLRQTLFDVSEGILLKFYQNLFEMKQTSSKLLSHFFDLVFGSYSMPSHFSDTLFLIVAYSTPLKPKIERLLSYWILSERFLSTHLFKIIDLQASNYSWSTFNSSLWHMLGWAVEQMSRKNFPTSVSLTLHKERLLEAISRIFNSDVSLREHILSHVLRLVFEGDCDGNSGKLRLPPLGSSFSYHQDKIKSISTGTRSFRAAEISSELLSMIYWRSADKAAIGQSVYSSLMLRLLPDNDNNVHLVPDIILTRLTGIIADAATCSSALQSSLLVSCQKLFGVPHMRVGSLFHHAFSREYSSLELTNHQQSPAFDFECRYSLADVGMILANCLLVNCKSLSVQDRDGLLDWTLAALKSANESSSLHSLRTVVTLLTRESPGPNLDKLIRWITPQVLELVRGCDFLRAAGPCIFELSLERLTDKILGILEEASIKESWSPNEVGGLIPRVAAAVKELVTLAHLLSSRANGTQLKNTIQIICSDGKEISDSMLNGWRTSSGYLNSDSESNEDARSCLLKAFFLSYSQGDFLHNLCMESAAVTPSPFSRACFITTQIDLLRSGLRCLQRNARRTGRPSPLKRENHSESSNNLSCIISSGIEDILNASWHLGYSGPISSALHCLIDFATDNELFTQLPVSFLSYLAIRILHNSAGHDFSLEMHLPSSRNFNDGDTISERVMVLLISKLHAAVSALERHRKLTSIDDAGCGPVILQRGNESALNLGCTLDRNGFATFTLMSYRILLNRIQMVRANADIRGAVRMLSSDVILQAAAGDIPYNSVTLGLIYKSVEDQVKTTQDILVATAGFRVLVEMAYGTSLMPRVSSLAFLMSTLVFNRQIQLHKSYNSSHDNALNGIVNLVNLSSLAKDIRLRGDLLNNQDSASALLHTAVDNLEHTSMFAKDFSASLSYLTAWWLLENNEDRMDGLSLVLFDVVAALRGEADFTRSRVNLPSQSADSLTALGKRMEWSPMESRKSPSLELTSITPTSSKNDRKIKRISVDDDDGVVRSNKRVTRGASEVNSVDSTLSSSTSHSVSSFTYLRLENAQEFFILGFSLLPATIDGLSPRIQTKATHEDFVDGPYCSIIYSLVVTIWTLNELTSMIKRNDNIKFMLDSAPATVRGCNALIDVIHTSVQKCAEWRNKQLLRMPGNDEGPKVNDGGALEHLGTLIAIACEAINTAQTFLRIFRRQLMDEGSFQVNKLVRRTLPTVLEKCEKKLKLLGTAAVTHSIDLHEVLMKVRRQVVYRYLNGSPSWILRKTSHFKAKKVDLVECSMAEVVPMEEVAAVAYCDPAMKSSEDNRFNFEVRRSEIQSPSPPGWNLFQYSD